MATNAPNKDSKTISQLDSFQASSEVDIRSLGLPAQYGSKNYQVLISQILEALTKTDVGLGLVDNTSDQSKPVSDATQRELDKKALVNHTHTISSVTGLAERFADFFTKNDQIPLTNLTSVVEALLGKANSVHTHAISEVTGLTQELGGKADVTHQHNLSSLPGYQELMFAINTAIDSRPTRDVVSQMIQAAIPSNIVTDTPPEW